MTKENMIIWKWIDKEKGIVALCPIDIKTNMVTTGLTIITSKDDEKFNIVGEWGVETQ
jgi:hypothetical protein